jgi:nitrate reductase gamma subunit
MPTWLKITYSPLFIFAVALCAFGLGRLALLALGGVVGALYRAGDRRLPVLKLVKTTFSWLVPVTRLHRIRPVTSYASFIFHLGILFALFTLRNHIDILHTSLSLGWPAVYKPVLDWLTLGAIVTGLYLLFFRMYNSEGRRMSKFMDYFLLLLILGIFISGYLGGRSWNPIPYDSLMLFHTLSGLALLILIPFTKIAHCVLFPLVRFASQAAWRLTPQGGSQVIHTLYGPDGRKV